MKAVLRKLLKLLAKHMPRYQLRAALLRLCGYEVGRDVYIGEDLIIIDELTGASSLPCDARLVGVEMSFLDVHVNRCPIGGEVTLLKHIEGGFMSLRREESPFVNARCTTVIENRSLTVAVVQVASRLVRRVESYLSQGATVDRGQRLGIIRFGSLVAVVLPQREDVRIEVKPGDLVKAGVSILARCQENAVRGRE
jgi:phosphatidylserine decarboxylase